MSKSFQKHTKEAENKFLEDEHYFAVEQRVHHFVWNAYAKLI